MQISIMYIIFTIVASKNVQATVVDNCKEQRSLRYDAVTDMELSKLKKRYDPFIDGAIIV